MKQIDKLNQRVIFWTSLLVLGLSSILLDFVLMFLMLLISPLFIYIIIIIIGLFFGFVFSFLILDLYYLERKHHIFLAFYIPSIVLINVYILMSGVYSLSNKLGIIIKVSPYIVSFFLIFSFTLPYLFFGLSALFKKSK